jgi:Flp pilus assembly protein TadD
MPAPPGIDLDSPEGQQAFDLLRTGQEHLLNEEPEAALDAFSQAVELVPEAPTSYAGQALALMMMDEDVAAREAIDQALALDPNNAEARLANAIFLFRQDNRLEARRELRELSQDQYVPPFVRERATQMLERMER